MPIVICAECKQERTHKGRGLCQMCFNRCGVREEYPLDESRVDQTMAELDAMIAEGMQNLPDWWKKESEKPDDERRLCRKTLRTKKPSKRAGQGKIGI